MAHGANAFWRRVQEMNKLALVMPMADGAGYRWMLVRSSAFFDGKRIWMALQA